MKTTCRKSSRGTGLAIVKAVCVVAVLLRASNTEAQELFATDFDNGNVYQFTPTGTQNTFASGLAHPTALTFDAFGNLFVADSGSGTIFTFTQGGVKTTFASGLSNPQGLAFDRNGNLYESDWNSGIIYRFSPLGVKSTFVSGMVAPSGLAFDSHGNLFVEEQNGGMAGGNDIKEITPAGMSSVFAGTLGSGLAFNSAGDLFEAEWSTGSLNEFTPDGDKSVFASGLRFPWGVAMDANDELYVSDLATWQIYRFSQDGKHSIFASGTGYGFDGLAIKPVPEPSVLGLLGLFSVALLALRTRTAFRRGQESRSA